MPPEPERFVGLSTPEKPGLARTRDAPVSSSSTITEYFHVRRRCRGRPRKLKTGGASENTSPSPARCLYDELQLLVPDDVFGLEELEEPDDPNPPLDGPLLGTDKSVLLNLFGDVRLSPPSALVNVPRLLCTEPALDTDLTETTETTESTKPPTAPGGCKRPAKKRVRFEAVAGTRRGGPEKAPRPPAGRLYGLVVEPVAEMVIWS